MRCLDPSETDGLLLCGTEHQNTLQNPHTGHVDGLLWLSTIDLPIRQSVQHGGFVLLTPSHQFGIETKTEADTGNRRDAFSVQKEQRDTTRGRGTDERSPVCKPPNYTSVPHRNNTPPTQRSAPQEAINSNNNL